MKDSIYFIYFYLNGFFIQLNVDVSVCYVYSDDIL